MRLDATKPVDTEPPEFKRIRVKGAEAVDLDSTLQCDPRTLLAELMASHRDATLPKRKVAAGFVMGELFNETPLQRRRHFGGNVALRRRLRRRL